MFPKKFLFYTKERKLYQLILFYFRKKLLKFLKQWGKECLKNIKYINCSLMIFYIYGLNAFHTICFKYLRQNMSYFQVTKSMSIWSIFKLKCFCLQPRPP